jgi:ATP-binding cassette, subfamily F, member 3
METREALTLALSSFGGALILVSHDRHLLRAATDQLWLVHDGRVAPFDGDLDEYTALVLASRRAARDAEVRPATDAANRRDDRREAARERQRLAGARRPLQQKIDRLEDDIARLAGELRELDTKLAAAEFYHGETDAVAAALRNRGLLAAKLETLESRWLQLHEQLESIT